jgi:hypothetical protein
MSTVAPWYLTQVILSGCIRSVDAKPPAAYADIERFQDWRVRRDPEEVSSPYEGRQAAAGRRPLT